MDELLPMVAVNIISKSSTMNTCFTLGDGETEGLLEGDLDIDGESDGLLEGDNDMD